MPYPKVREAKPGDYDSIWSIWMQDHVHQWMSFVKEDKEAFKKRYNELAKKSDIYVLIDLVSVDAEGREFLDPNGTEKVLGVRRIQYGDGPYKHVAEYCSMGIHKDFQGNGYGKRFYKEFDEIIAKKGIKKVELTQSSNNEGARYIADKLLFSEEAVFPDWLERTNDGGAYHIYERFIYKFYDDEVAQLAKTLPSLKYEEVFPDLKTQDSVKIKRKNNVKNTVFTCYHDYKPLFTLIHEPNATTYSHIGFLSFELLPKEYSPEALAGLKMILGKILQEGRVEKVELFGSNSIVIQLCQHAGFFVRGEKKASRCENGVYQNELGLEYSFFGIEDAKKLFYSQIDNPSRRGNVEKALNRCQETIQAFVSEGLCDSLGSRYLENLIYQMVRDELGQKDLFSLTEKNWQPLLSYVPHALWVDMNDLYKQIHTVGLNFFKPPALFFDPPHASLKTGHKQNPFK